MSKKKWIKLWVLLVILILVFLLSPVLSVLIYQKFEKSIDRIDNSMITEKWKYCDSLKQQKDKELEEWYNVSDESFSSMLLDSKIIYNKSLDSCIWAYKRLVTFPEDHQLDSVWYKIENYSRWDETLFGCEEKDWQTYSYSDANFNKSDLSLNCEDRRNKRIEFYRN